MIEVHLNVKVQQQWLHVDHISLTNNLLLWLVRDIEQLIMMHHEFAENKQKKEC